MQKNTPSSFAMVEKMEKYSRAGKAQPQGGNSYTLRRLAEKLSQVGEVERENHSIGKKTTKKIEDCLLYFFSRSQ
jgi:hypothetical protein